jgi:hypothetical protein
MRFLGRLPIYAAGLGFTVAVVAVAAARDWSGWETIAAALGVGVFYVLTIVVPWLVREQSSAAGGVTEEVDGNGQAVVELYEAVVKLHEAGAGEDEVILVAPDFTKWPQATTRGDEPVEPREPSVAVPS